MRVTNVGEMEIAGGVTLTRMGAVIAKNITIDEFCHGLQNCQKLANASMWAIGDLLVYGEGCDLVHHRQGGDEQRDADHSKQERGHQVLNQLVPVHRITFLLEGRGASRSRCASRRAICGRWG